MNFLELWDEARARVAAPVPGAMVLWLQLPHVMSPYSLVYWHVTSERAVRRAWASHQDGRSIQADSDLLQLQRMQAASLPGPTIRTREVSPVPETVLAELRAVSLEPAAEAHYIDPSTWGFTRDGQSVEWKVRGPEGFQRAWDALECLDPPA